MAPITLPTIAIHSTKHPLGYVLINARDFDPTKHAAYFDEAGKPTTKPKAPMAPPALEHEDDIDPEKALFDAMVQTGDIPDDSPAVQGHGAIEPTLESPAAFERMNAKDAVAFVKHLSAVEPLEALARIEEAGKNRVTVLEAIDKRKAELEG